MSENSLSASETSNSQYLDDLANQNLNISQYLEGPTNPDLDIRQHLNDPTILSGCMVPVTIQSFTTDPDNITPTTITARLCGFGWGAVQFIAFYDSQESQTPSGYALVRGMESDWTDKQIADYATTQVLREMPNTDESLKSLMLDAIEDFRQRSDQTRADNDALLGLLPFEQISPKYAETRDELLSQNGQEPTSAEIFEALVAKYSQNSNETEIVNTPAIEDANNNADSPEVTPATPRIRVTITNNYDRDPDSPFYDAYVMLKNSGALILPMDGKVTVWPSDVIEYLNKNYPDWDTDSYTEEEIAALQDTYSHLLNGDYLMQGSDNNTLTNTNKTDTTVTDTTTPDTTVTLEQEGTTIIQNHLYPGVKIHMVQYGETQEYLESLQDEGYLLGYNKDNPPEEGKLTISKPNPDPGTITVVANPTDMLPSILQDPADTTGADPAGLIAGMKSYLEEIAPKMSDIDSLTDEEVASFNETLKSFKEALRQADVATYLADTTLDPRTDTGMNPETFDPRTDTSLNDLLDSYIAALDEKEAKTADTTGTDTTTADTTDTEYYYEMDNWSVGENGELIYKDSTKYIKFTSTDLPFCLVSLDNRGRMMGDMDPPGQESTPPPVVTIEDLTPVLIPVSSELLQRFEEAKKLRQRFAERSNPIAFVSIMDAETEAVKSVQVACADTDGWHEIGTLNNPDGIDWKYQAGNLTGSGTASVVWHAQELGALGVWTDGTDNWTGIAGWFDANWTMLGCGDFDGDGKDSVLMSLSGGQFYSVDLDGTLTSLGGLNWSGWEFGAVGDFAGDGKDDIVLLHRESGSVVLLADGNADNYKSIGQLDASDWNIAGAGDFDGDGRADLLVRQDSTGLIGGYAGADMNQWSVVGNAHYLYSDTAVLA